MYLNIRKSGKYTSKVLGEKTPFRSISLFTALLVELPQLFI